jgi:drug/metabolite transporter (DMT)-like permease
MKPMGRLTGATAIPPRMTVPPEAEPDGALGGLLGDARRLSPGAASRLGIALGVFAYVLFGVHDASIKFLVETLPVWQVLFFRSVTIMVICVAIGRTKLLVRAVASPVKASLVGRAGLTLAAWMLYFTASRHLALAQMTALYYTAPVMVTLMAAPLLGERVTAGRWLSVGLGFCGVLLASGAAGGADMMSISWPALLVLIAASFWGYGVILMRHIARRESSMMQMLVTNVLFSIATGTACLVSWVPMSGRQLALVAVIVVFGGLAQFIMFEAARIAAASVMATVEYSGLIWAFALGFLIWGEVPGLNVFAGALLILVSGALLVMVERRRA